MENNEELLWMLCKKVPNWKWKSIGHGGTQWYVDGYRYEIVEPNITKEYDLERELESRD
jgi:hypothetical protein